MSALGHRREELEVGDMDEREGGMDQVDGSVERVPPWDSMGPAPWLPPTDFARVSVLRQMPEGLDPERSPFTADRDNALIAAASRINPEAWWADGAMVNRGLPGDESFVGDAASAEDANRIVEAHNAALIDARSA
jgi:hypothetical protein